MAHNARVLVASRYLRRLHFSLKKGRWSPEEEEQLLGLVEKHGVGESCGRRQSGGGGVPPRGPGHSHGDTEAGVSWKGRGLARQLWRLGPPCGCSLGKAFPIESLRPRLCRLLCWRGSF